MSWLDANDPAFVAQYPDYCRVYDARGRRIMYVRACNPQTGEVIRYQFKRSRFGGEMIAAIAGGGPWMRHGFFPAPLRLVPCQSSDRR